jgi:putative transport protein
MELDVYRLLEGNPVLVLFLILGLGLLVGELRVVGVKLGGVTGVLVIGLVVGHFGLAVPTASHDIGFLLFI